jgi:hypothetical protein
LRAAEGIPTPAIRTRTELHLKVTGGPATGAEHTVPQGGSATLGRSEEADFSLGDSRISRLHCRVEFAEGRWVARDLDSRNGTWVGGRKIREHPLADGETIVLGKSTEVMARIREVRPGGAGRRVVFPSRDAEAATAPVAPPEPLPALEGPLLGLPGTILGEFRVIEQARPLGRAAFFRAMQPNLNRHVLLEVFTEDDMSRPGMRESLEREVQRASPLLHPNVLQIYDYGTARGFTYVTMEFFQGRTLARVLSSKGFVPIPRALGVARQLSEAFAAGVDCRAAVGTVHPADIWVDDEFTVKVKLFREPGSPPPAPESFAYQAPEVLAGGDPSAPQAAVYTVGALLYHMLAATPPLTGASKAEMARRARHDTPTPLRRVNIKVTPILARVVEQALAKEPGKRQDGIRGLDRELQRAISPTL